MRWRSWCDIELPEFEVLLTCNYKLVDVPSTGRLKLRLIYISNYESEWGKISAQPHTFIMYEAISYFFRQTVYMNTVESTQNECTGLYGNLYLAVMLIVLECCQTHDMSLYIEGQTDCWECWWMNSRNNHFTHPPFPSLVSGQELRNTQNHSYILWYYSKSDLISSRVFSVRWDPQYVLVPNLKPTDNRF